MSGTAPHRACHFDQFGRVGHADLAAQASFVSCVISVDLSTETRPFDRQDGAEIIINRGHFNRHSLITIFENNDMVSGVLELIIRILLMKCEACSPQELVEYSRQLSTKRGGFASIRSPESCPSNRPGEARRQLPFGRAW